ncbi:hypothetical protein E2C01_014817 [Portunus trituberculatus]|uniref:Uncharacterized protein n=1 Tax=Portunus trituberculatus TaxID=210409 RepID=A0A5B7DL38_PORTR|nr:hypothetical protein [Portunus trituberculatus]
MIPSRISRLLCVQHTEMCLGHGNSNHSKEIQHNTSSGPPNCKEKTPETPSAWWILRRDWRNMTRYRYGIVIERP